jgi:hypothetical protein
LHSHPDHQAIFTDARIKVWIAESSQQQVLRALALLGVQPYHRVQSYACTVPQLPRRNGTLQSLLNEQHAYALAATSQFPQRLQLSIGDRICLLSQRAE